MELMTKTEMVAKVLHSTGFNSNFENCNAFALERLLEEAGSAEVFQRWNTQVNDEFAERYVANCVANQVWNVRWPGLYRELS